MKGQRVTFKGFMGQDDINKFKDMLKWVPSEDGHGQELAFDFDTTGLYSDCQEQNWENDNKPAPVQITVMLKVLKKKESAQANSC